MHALFVAVALALAGLQPANAQRFRARLKVNTDTVSSELLSRCSKHSFETNLDHFSRSKGPNGEETFDLRYYICDGHHRAADAATPPGPVFFYLGNEADVLLYLNNTGLMWENAEDFGAMLVFAEHRYYGESRPFGGDTEAHMAWLSAEQALGDYAALLTDLKATRGLQDAPVIGFGGSYGGMLATWARLKYPHIWQGAIAGSAPIWTFYGEEPPMDPYFFAKGVTYDATERAGAAPGCRGALQRAWRALEDIGKADGGPARLSDALDICPEVALNSTANVTDVRDWAASAFDYLAMGNYPYPSSYMLNGHGSLPAFPMRAACKRMMAAAAPSRAAAHAVRGDAAAAGHGAVRKLSADGARHGCGAAALLEADGLALVKGLAAAASVWYNHTGELTCLNPWKQANAETKHTEDFWGYQYCTEMFMPFAKGSDGDMFWDDPWDEVAARKQCRKQWGVEPRRLWPTAEWGGRSLSALTNVVFSNGLYDPWHGGGVMTDLSRSVLAVVIPEGAHHLDLMFSHPDDPLSVKAARAAEVANIRQWITEYHAVRGQAAPGV